MRNQETFTEALESDIALRGRASSQQLQNPNQSELERAAKFVIDLTGPTPLVNGSRSVPSGAVYLEGGGGLMGASRRQLALKRIFDIAIASAALVVLFPLLLLAAAAIRVTSRGPILFDQERVGANGKTFKMLKFRTMVSEAPELLSDLVLANEQDGPVFKIRDDPRLTNVGRIMRRFSMDEMPQLFHVLSGRMAVVGPRPPLPEEVATYNEWERQRILVKPGLTCIWQVSGRCDLDFETWVRMDVEYIGSWSPALDIKILRKTFGAVLGGRGAY